MDCPALLGARSLLLTACTRRRQDSVQANVVLNVVDSPLAPPQASGCCEGLDRPSCERLAPSDFENNVNAGGHRGYR